MDEEAFAALFHQYKNLVYKTAYLMLGCREDAEDALQEVFLQVHRSLSTYDPSRGAVTTWLHRITVNHCLSRRRKLRPSQSPLEEVFSDDGPVDPASPVVRLEEEEDVHRAIGLLSEKLRAVVVLRHYWELSYVEIAQILEIPVGTVKSRLDLALKTLRRELQAGAKDAPVRAGCPRREATK